MPTDLIKSTLEGVLFKMSYSVDTLPTYLDYLKTKDDTHLNIFHVATSECVNVGQINCSQQICLLFFLSRMGPHIDDSTKR